MNKQAMMDWTGPRGMCRCGHTGDGQGSEHHTLEDERAPGAPAALMEGRGACAVESCNCERFTWVTFVDGYPPK